MCFNKYKYFSGTFLFLAKSFEFEKKCEIKLIGPKILSFKVKYHF